jgi:hypothetical protein
MIQFTLERGCKGGDVLYQLVANNGLSLEARLDNKAVARFDADYRPEASSAS